MKTIVVASWNAHKIAEIKTFFPHDTLLSMKEIGFTDEIVEDGTTFAENALIKARAIHDFLQKQGKEYLVLADDSGLCVNALGGKPGILSARYSGEHGNDQKNREKILTEMQGQTERTAFFSCCMVEVFPDGQYLIWEGKVMGKILEQEEGEWWFWYDPIFYCDELGKSFWVATAEEKNSVSHRARAIQNLLEQVSNLLMS